jgi:predicted transcriptional regulator
MKPTKRQIQIVEHFVKKTTKTMMNEATKISKTQPFKIYMPAMGELPDNHAVVTYDPENFVFKIRDDARRTTKMSEKDLLRKIKSKEYILESTLKSINEGTAHNQIKYNMTTLHKQLQKLNQHVQSNPEFKDGDPIKSGIANVLVAFNKFFETNK